MSFGVNTIAALAFENRYGDGEEEDPTPCETVLFSSIYHTIVARVPGTFVVDTAGSEMDTVMVITVGEPPEHRRAYCDTGSGPVGRLHTNSPNVNLDLRLDPFPLEIPHRFFRVRKARP